MGLSVIIPAKDEASSISSVISQILEMFPDAEVLVIDDGSVDSTAARARDARATVISHPRSLGNGAAIKTGARHATGDVLVMLDADGQHDPADIPRLLEQLDAGHHMVVGARSSGSHANIGRLFANGSYNVIASAVSGRQIKDLTSGFRAVRAELFRKFLYLLPNGFSYPTTITMAFIRSGYSVEYIDIDAGKRAGRSHIRPFRDGIRFLLIIFKIATLYAPLKIFLPVSVVFFLTGLAYYIYTFAAFGRFTNMSLLLFSAAVIVFLIGMISEQITALMFRDS